MDMTLLKEGTVIMIIGMGTVFFFLVIMICAMNINELILKFIGKYFPEEIPEIKAIKKKVESSDDEIALAIALLISIIQKQLLIKKI
ncbi:OadG family protein [bacterium]|nr:OadG family protein [bacterium]